MKVLTESSYNQTLLDYFDTDLNFVQKNILLLFSYQNKIIGRTRLQKLLFLIDNEVLDTPCFEFRPYKFGPYSAKLLAAMDELMELGLIKEKMNECREPDVYVTEYEISAIGLERADEIIKDINPSKAIEIEEMVHQHGYSEIDSILHHVYVKYPDYTENSVIKEAVLNYS